MYIRKKKEGVVFFIIKRIEASVYRGGVFDVQNECDWT